MPREFPQVIGNWWLGDTLGSGYSGYIFKARHIHTGQVAALKLQRVDHECPTNRYERTFYPALQGGVGMPILFGSGIHGQWDYLVIELLGSSLDSLFRQSGKKTMDLGSVCCIAMQMIERLETMHNRGVLHRDIQLGNTVVGLAPNQARLYMIDFGFSKKYIDPVTREHLVDSRRKRDFIGNYWFSSVAVHCKGRVPTRRDDMEALALMLIHLLTPGGLSWTRNGVPKTDEAHDILKREKQNTTPEELCRGLPSEFEEFLRYCRSLKFAERPDYERWILAFQDLAIELGFSGDPTFVWPPPANARYAQASKRVKPAKATANVDRIMHDLAKLNLGERPVLGARDNNVAQAARAAAAVPDKAKKTRKPTLEPDIIELSSDSEAENEGQKKGVVRLTKATQLIQLVRRTREITDNVALARVVREFTELLESSRSRTLTKEGFAFLDALYKQLADPSVFIVPLRTSKRQHTTQRENLNGADDRTARTHKLLALRRDIAHAKSNKQVAQLVAEFGATVDKTKNRTLTKDSIAFLNSLGTSLRALS